MTDQVNTSTNVAPEDVGIPTGAAAFQTTEVNDTPTQQEIVEAPAGEMFKVIVDGKEMDISREELLNGYQRAKASDSKFREAQSLTTQAEQLLQMLQENPRYVLQTMGVDLDGLTNEYLSEVIQEELMSPEQKELRDYKNKLSKYEEAQRRQEEEQYLIQQEAAAEQYTNQIVSELTTAMEGSGLNKRQSQKIMQDSAKYKMALLEQGKDIPIGVIAKKLIADYKHSQSEMLTQADVNYLVQVLGKDKVNQLIRHQTTESNKMPQSKSPMVSKQTTSAKDKERIPKSKLNPWLER
jgi:hypothetical protein